MDKWFLAYSMAIILRGCFWDLKKRKIVICNGNADKNECEKGNSFLEYGQKIINRS